MSDKIVLIDGQKCRQVIEIDSEGNESIRYELVGERVLTPQDEVDAMVVDHEYRLTLLELNASGV